MVERLVDSRTDTRSFARRALLFAALFVAAVAPTTPLMQFFRTPENLVVAAALETRRTGNWIAPTLEGELRTAKPPLSTWITAAAVWSSTLQRMSDASETARADAARWLAWETRWPAVLMAGATLLATAELGRLLLGDSGVGISSLLLCGSGFLFLKFSSEAATDTNLLLWVTVANVCLCRAVFKQQYWPGYVGAGVAIGLAIMSKGPVALLQTIVPFGVFLLVQRRSVVPLRQWIWPAIVGVACAFAIAMPWPLLLLMRAPARQWHEWVFEVTGQSAPERRDPFWSYPVRLLEAVTPCFVLLIAGIWRGWRSRKPGLILALLWLLLPIAIMSLFKDRKDRYLLPLMPVAAVLSAAALSLGKKRDAVEWAHWIITAGLSVALPIAAASSLFQSSDNQAALSPAFAVTAALSALMILLVALLTHCPAPVATFAVMLIVQFVSVIAVVRTSGGQSEMLPLANAIWHAAPDAQLLNGQPVDIRTSVDLSIYLNRITRWLPTEQWHGLQPATFPRVVILLQHAGEPIPAVDGWRRLASVGRGKERWWALMMPRQ